ncbi:MAG: hypothetical protein ACTSXK_00525 [Promethearchaeota archaeon]
METISEYKESLKNLEKQFNKRAINSSKIQYAFIIEVYENEYDLLKHLYLSTEYFRDYFSYPWCHIKLLTETCARYLTKEDKHLEESITKHIGIQKLYKGYWDNIKSILNILNLKTVRSEGGTWSIYANIVLHAGIIYKNFESLIDKAQSKLEATGQNLERAIDLLFYDKSTIADTSYSKYFKNAFSAEYEKRILCNWLVKFCFLSARLLNRVELPGVPSYFQSFIEKKYLKSESSFEKPQINFKHIFKFNIEKGHIELRLNLSSEDDFKNNINLNGSVPQHWKKPIENSMTKKHSSVVLPVLPKDIGLPFSYSVSGKRKLLHIISKCQDISIILINMKDFTVIIPEMKNNYIEICNMENSISLAILSNTEISNLTDPEIGFCKSIGSLGHTFDEWYYWHFYEFYENNLRKSFSLELPAPYYKMNFKIDREVQNLETGWYSEQLFNSDVTPAVFGGSSPPEILISSTSENKPFVICDFKSLKNQFSIVGIVFKYKNYWKCKFDVPKDIALNVNYFLKADIYPSFELGISDSAKNVEIVCRWLPSLIFLVSRNHICFQSCPINLELKGADIRHKYSVGLPNHESSDDYLKWQLCDEIQSLNPVIGISFNNDNFEFIVPLPYISVSLSYKKQFNLQNTILKWNSKEPFSLDFIKEIVNHDYNANFHFDCFYQKKILILSDDKKNLYQMIDFSLSPHLSISCFELLNFILALGCNSAIIVIEENEEEAALFSNIKNEDDYYCSIYSKILQKRNINWRSYCDEY